MREQFIANIKEAEKAVEAFSAEQFNLSRYVIRNECGTLFCSFGVVMSTPYFNQLGLKYQAVDVDMGHVAIVLNDTVRNDDDEVMDSLFGPDSYDRLFEVFGAGKYDTKLRPQFTADEWADAQYWSRTETGANVVYINSLHKRLALLRFNYDLAMIAEGELDLDQPVPTYD